MTQSTYPIPKPAIGVGAVVFDAEGRVLLVRRGRPPAVGFWSLPGGKQEAGETLRECCQRELLEETGLAVEPGPIVALAERRLEGFHYVIVDFLARPAVPGPAPRLAPASDVADARWVVLAELGAYELVEGMREVIRAARSVHGGESVVGLVDWGGEGRLFLPEAPDKSAQ